MDSFRPAQFRSPAIQRWPVPFWDTGLRTRTPAKLANSFRYRVPMSFRLHGRLTATARIREREQATRTHVPIVAMTAHAMQGDKDRFLAVGMADYVSKPIRSGDLNAAIAHVVRSGKATAESQPESSTETGICAHTDAPPALKET